jgi:serine phosphatase RsbU (regulator of sigma subunit)/tetratricopeptide (TPR) repeat protein
MRILLYIKLLIINILAFHSLGLAQSSKTDSLEKLLPKFSAPDINRLQILQDLCWQFRNSKPEKALEYGKSALDLAEKLKLSSKIAQINTFVGAVYRNLGNYPKSLSHYLEAARVAEKAQDFERLGFALQSVADLNQRQTNFKEALNYLKSALGHFQKINNQPGLGYTYYTYGQTYEGMKDYPKALEYYLKSLEIRQKLSDRNAIASSQFRLGGLYQKMKKYSESIRYLDQAEKNFLELNDSRGVAQVLHREAQIYLTQNNLKMAENQAITGLEIAKKAGLKEQLPDFYADLAKIAQSKQEYKQAFDYQQLYLAYHDSLLSQEKNNQMSYLEASYKDEKRQIQFELLKADNQRKNLINYAVISGLAFVVLLALLLYRNNLQKQKTNQQLSLANAEIEEKNKNLQDAYDEIEAQHYHISQSINYAQTIQKAMLPQADKFRKILPESFIFFKPRDIVSGDFYWVYETPDQNQVVLVVADCTGHGVPGALMSMIGESLLDQIVQNQEIYQPDLILNELHKGVRLNLNQTETENRDGMDVVVCTINRKTRKLYYAGAVNPIYYAQNGQFIRIRGDKYHVGGYFISSETHNPRKFTGHEIDISVPTMFYLSSDGYQDQFGGEFDRKFMLPKYREFLASMAHLPIQEQAQKIEKTLADWMGKTHPQTDDILVIGVNLAI